MKYAVKVVINKREKAAHVFGPLKVPNCRETYNIKHVGWSEFLRIFDTEDEAKKAYEYELLAAKYQFMDPDALRAEVEAAVEHAASVVGKRGRALLYRFAGVNSKNFRLHLIGYRREAPSPRKVAQVVIAARLLIEAHGKADSSLKVS